MNNRINPVELTVSVLMERQDLAGAFRLVDKNGDSTPESVKTRLAEKLVGRGSYYDAIRLVQLGANRAVFVARPDTIERVVAAGDIVLLCNILRLLRGSNEEKQIRGILVKLTKPNEMLAVAEAAFGDGEPKVEPGTEATPAEPPPASANDVVPPPLPHPPTENSTPFPDPAAESVS